MDDLVDGVVHLDAAERPGVAQRFGETPRLLELRGGLLVPAHRSRRVAAQGQKVHAIGSSRVADDLEAALGGA